MEVGFISASPGTAVHEYQKGDVMVVVFFRMEEIECMSRDIAVSDVGEVEDRLARHEGDESP